VQSNYLPPAGRALHLLPHGHRGVGAEVPKRRGTRARFPQAPASIGPLVKSLDELIAGGLLYESFIHWLR
jgi:hypothetical protein